MSQKSASSSRARKRQPGPVKQRTAIGALGGFIGAITMSAIAAVLLTVAVTPVVALTGVAATSAINVFNDLPNHLDPGQQAQPSNLYAVKSDGSRTKIATFYVQDRVEVGWGDISQYVKDAAVAVEDPQFYSHGGVNVLSAARAAVQNVTGTGESGASTITMQYVRNVLVQEAEAILDEEEHEEAYAAAMEQEIDRKLKEMRLAISVEKKFTKNEILLGYLNIALFGRQVYGIESAAQFYFGKSAKDVSLAEAASLVAIVNWPSKFQIDVEENIPANTERRNLILERMLQHGKITQAQYDEAVETPVTPNITPKVSGCSAASQSLGLGHFCNYVQTTIALDPSFGNTPQERMFTFARGGFDIETTIDLDLQQAAHDSITSNIAPQIPGLNGGGAAVSVEVGTGRVLAMVQNRPFSEDPAVLDSNPGYTSINYNTDYEYGGSRGFQVGSTFKAFTLANWIKEGRSVQEIVNTNGRTVQERNVPAKCMDGGVYGWGSFEFRNHMNRNLGSRSVLYAMGQSLNGGFVSMMEKTDLCDIIDMAEALGVHRASDQEDQYAPNYGTRKLAKVPSNVYGGIDEIAPISMATAYAAFASGGKVCEPTPIDRITDPNGEEVQFTKNTCKQAITPDVAAGTAYALQYNVTNGIAPHARSAIGVPHLAKTGTTDDFVDNWTVGASTKVSTAMWTGNVVGKRSTEFSGLVEAIRTVWPTIMNAADAKYGGEAFPEPNPDALRVVMKGVPDTTGQTYEEAEQMLRSLGFQVRDGGDRDSSVQNGRVAETDPAGGTDAPEGSDVTIYRSNGKLKSIPDGLVGETAQAARQILQNAGFSNIRDTCETGDRGGRNALVSSVTPSSGSEAKPENQVILYLDCGDD